MNWSLIFQTYFCSALIVTGQWMWKLALKSRGSGDVAQLGFWIRLLGSPWMIFGLAVYSLATILWIILLKKFSLGITYPLIIGFALINSVLVSTLLLKEPVTVLQIVGVIFMVVSIILISGGN